jgi:hypothetical protein
MRTKTLLIAAAALAATVISSEAQVYSANIVGYVNSTLPGNGAFSLIVAPLVGTTNAADVMMPCLQSGDSLLIWNYANSTYAQAYYIGPGANQPGGTGYGNWSYDLVNVTNGPALSPGEGFFYSTGSGNQETNTWVGTVVLTNSITLPGNGAFSLLGSTPPVSDYADSTNINLPLQSGDSVLVFNPASSSYAQDYYIGPGYNQPGGTGYGNWSYDLVNVTNAPIINVGQGFFYSTGSGNTEQWNQQLILQ